MYTQFSLSISIFVSIVSKSTSPSISIVLLKEWMILHFVSLSNQSCLSSQPVTWWVTPRAFSFWYFCFYFICLSRDVYSAISYFFRTNHMTGSRPSDLPRTFYFFYFLFFTLLVYTTPHAQAQVSFWFSSASDIEPVILRYAVWRSKAIWCPNIQKYWAILVSANWVNGTGLGVLPNL